MKSTYLLFLLPVFSFLSSCSDDDDAIPSVTISTASFKITGLEYYAEQYQDTLIELEDEISYNWHPNDRMDNHDSVWMVKYASLQYNTSTSNYCEELVIKLEKREAKNNLVYDTYFQRWKYKSLDDEYHLFYQGYDSAYVEVNFCYLRTSLRSGRQSENFKINKVTKVLVSGDRTWAISATFKGLTYDSYYYGENTPYFNIQEGKFEGVLN